MGAETKIEWARHTFNPWVGCTKISPACDHCYAESWAKRTGQAGLWAGQRRRTSVSNWQQPIKWNKAAAAAGERHRVFCASLADVFDNQVPLEWRADLFDLIDTTPHLNWLLLTKRPQNIMKMIQPRYEGILPRNVWLGTTVENQAEADRRIPQILGVPAVVHFISAEPLLGPLDLWLYLDAARQFRRRLDWVIAGGESGPKARPPNPIWFRQLRDQCATAGTAFLFKQHGEWLATCDDNGSISYGKDARCYLGDETSWEPWLYRVGKKNAGRLLDGIEHNGFPEAA